MQPRDYVQSRLEDSVHVLRGDALSLPFQDCSFDFILCTEVLEHLANPLKGAQEIRRVLKIGGKALISMPNLISAFWMFNRIIAEFRGFSMGKTEIDPHMKYPFFSILTILKDAGFEVRAVRGTYMVPSDLLFKISPNSRNIARLVYILGWIEQNLNVKQLNAFFFALATKQDHNIR